MVSLLSKCLSLLEKDEPIIVPTDTVYGLVCKYNSKKAVAKIYKLKKRDRKKPLILLGYDWKSLEPFVILNRRYADTPIRRYVLKWPGPLTIILPASKRVPKFLNKGYETIGIRVPDNKFLLSLLKKCPSKILASTSANISGKKNVYEVSKKVKLFVRAKRGEMSYRPSKVIEIVGNKIKIIRN